MEELFADLIFVLSNAPALAHENLILPVEFGPLRQGNGFAWQNDILLSFAFAYIKEKF